jgi:hypothetical protein
MDSRLRPAVLGINQGLGSWAVRLPQADPAGAHRERVPRAHGRRACAARRLPRRAAAGEDQGAPYKPWASTQASCKRGAPWSPPPLTSGERDAAGGGRGAACGGGGARGASVHPHGAHEGALAGSVSLTVSRTASLPHLLSHRLSHCVPLTVSLTVSLTTPSPPLSGTRRRSHSTAASQRRRRRRPPRGRTRAAQCTPRSCAPPSPAPRPCAPGSRWCAPSGWRREAAAASVGERAVVTTVCVGGFVELAVRLTTCGLAVAATSSTSSCCGHQPCEAARERLSGVHRQKRMKSQQYRRAPICPCYLHLHVAVKLRVPAA